MYAIPQQLLARIANLASPDPIYLVGGTIRDLLLHKDTISDIDIIAKNGSDKIARAFAIATNASFFYLDEQRGVSRVVTGRQDGSLQFDFANFDGPDLIADLGRRDFTVNAMATELHDFIKSYDIAQCHIIDQYRGRNDLRDGFIRLISPTALDDDPLRMLRAVRFAALLGFSLAPGVANEVHKRASTITSSSAERIRDEFFLILSFPGAGRHLLKLDSLGLLESIFPELLPLRGFTPGNYHNHDVLTHSFLTADYVEHALNQLVSLSVAHADQLRKHFDSPLERCISRMAALRFACLLHDVGKIDTFTRAENDEVHFYGHDQKGADKTRQICKRLKISTTASVVADKLVRNHMRPLQLTQANGPSRRSLYRYCRDLNDALPESVALSIADGRATSEAMQLRNFTDTSKTASLILAYYFDNYLITEDKPLVSGKDLIALGMQPGPGFRIILDAVREQQADGSLKSRQQALDFIRGQTKTAFSQ